MARTSLDASAKIITLSCIILLPKDGYLEPFCTRQMSRMYSLKIPLGSAETRCQQYALDSCSRIKLQCVSPASQLDKVIRLTTRNLYFSFSLRAHSSNFWPLRNLFRIFHPWKLYLTLTPNQSAITLRAITHRCPFVSDGCNLPHSLHEPHYM